ncbi:MAG: hypothetical protein JW958_01550 [Candidatus Eisenbacteria bacterium]|nr:hypothetical protein [Candidatus Eisenbacteria bacterium]
MFDCLRQNGEAAAWIAGASLAAFLFALAAVPRLVVRIPPDYFAPGKRRGVLWANANPVLRILLLVLKNAVGALFLLAGIAMLFLPGQGLLTILAGIALLDFPGKFRLARWLVSRGPLLRTINRLRRRAGRPPLVV